MTDANRNISTEPANGGNECRWGMKNRDFRQISRIISDMIQ